MKYVYRLKYIEIGPPPGPKRNIPVLLLPQEIELVTEFLLSDVQRPAQLVGYYISALERVLRRETPSEEAAGNVYRLEIRPDLTQVIDTLADDEPERSCVIETEELRALIALWSGLILDEVERFRTNLAQGQAPGLWLTLLLDLGEQPGETAEKFLDVIGLWLRTVHNLAQARATWPTDEQWKELLPRWFIATFGGHTPEEIHASGWLWDYGSWLDSMKERVWRWWSYERRATTLIVQLQLDSWPYSIGALVYLARVAGGELTVSEQPAGGKQ